MTGACSTLAMYLSNLVQTPEVPRYRRIATSNKTFKSMMGSMKGHEELLSAVGFSLTGSVWEWQWDHTKTAVNRPVLERVLIALQQAAGTAYVAAQG